MTLNHHTLKGYYLCPNPLSSWPAPTSCILAQLMESLSLVQIVPLWNYIPHHQPLNPTMANTKEISDEAVGAAERHFDSHSPQLRSFSKCTSLGYFENTTIVVFPRRTSYVPTEEPLLKNRGILGEVVRAQLYTGSILQPFFC